jgi:ABC-type branched-subunit amino acid transport system ATPase component
MPLDLLPRLRLRQTAARLSGGEAQMLADRALVLESGRIVGSGRGDQLAADPRLPAAYLGAPTVAE